MIGIFDSGVGGLTALYEMRQALARADIVYLADRKNAPYGTKTKEELIRLVTEDIRRLAERGAEKILIACCTASAVWGELPTRERENTVPIIRPAARAAAESARRGVAVIATEATVRLGAFSLEVARINPAIPVNEIAAQELVALVEGGCRDGRVSEKDLSVLCGVSDKIRNTGADTLILGCTHFSHLERTLASLTGMQTVSPAREGARVIIEEYKKLHPSRRGGTGRVHYL